MVQRGKIIRIAGPVIDVEGLPGVELYEILRVGDEALMGEVIKIQKQPGGRHITTCQIYEETAGLKPGEPAVTTGLPLSAVLGPGLIGQIFDGIQRPLPSIKDATGDFIQRGVEATALDLSLEFDFTPSKKIGDRVHGGSIIGKVPETTLVTSKILVPPRVKPGKIKDIKPEGKYPLKETLAIIETSSGEIPVKMYHEWPVRNQRPFASKLASDIPLITGQRIFDTFFPISKGGTGAIPGGFGTGKTVSQHQLAKWSDATVVVYIGCGERGNEMTEVLEEFPELEDPRTGEKLMKRTILIANTSNMPVAAREASIYTGITLAEFYRDQGFDVALMADSTSRWAEALREISGRLEEMPGEQGYPAYLASKVAEFYERAGRVETLNGDKASISAVGAVSPGGGDFSEPVTQNTLRTVRVFWALSKSLASSRHFPAISWLESYSMYSDSLEEWFGANVHKDFGSLREKAMVLLQKEKELQEIVQLVGPDALPESEKITLQAAKMIREDFLQQNAYSEDSYCSLEKQYQMLTAIMHFHKQMQEWHEKNISLDEIVKLPVVDEIARLKWRIDDFDDKYKMVIKEINSAFA